MKKLSVGSMFAGIGGFDLGFEREGYEVKWCIERDVNAQHVLARHFPNAVIYGDITQVNAKELASVDVICGGFPCQDVSVAGKRAGLTGERTGLFYDAMRIIRYLSPQLVILENVPGLLSSNNGLDFATVIREMGEGWDCQEVAWRVLDSQYFGVAQRRNRVFVVASSAIGHAEQVLALTESVCGDPPPRRTKRQSVTADTEDGVTRSVARHRGHGDYVMDEVASAMLQRDWKDNTDLVVIDRAAFNQGANAAYDPHIAITDLMDPLVARGPHALAYTKAKRAQSPTDDESWVEGEVSPTLNGFDVGDTRATTVVAATGSMIRRLTPIECERLQGFPDGWTNVGSAGKPTPDSHRYKQLGNAVTVNVAKWIASRARPRLEVTT